MRAAEFAGCRIGRWRLSVAGSGQPRIAAGAAFADVEQLDLLHAAKARTPLVEGRVAETVGPAQLLDRNAGLGLPQEADDLLIGESALLHVRSLLGKRTLLNLDLDRLIGAGQHIKRVLAISRRHRHSPRSKWMASALAGAGLVIAA